ncbi:Secretion protein HlyD family protein [Cucumis melo var. makuwa]|uniref:Secretion protein HlyD family protein n=1 Tax=Cucumis melo var. makuwa TaxID=1194695 RepID=A0A5D3BQ22_CUCMM|nr:Secretion protein HlyD family protein [Cucumis melo var. makuwa]
MNLQQMSLDFNFNNHPLNLKYSPPALLAINNTVSKCNAKKVQFGSTLIKQQNFVAQELAPLVHKQDQDPGIATRRTSLFEREQRRVERAACRTSSNQLPNINPFVYQGSCSSEVDEIEYLKRTFDIWRGLVEFPMEGESGFQDPSQGFILGLHDFRRAFTRFSISFGRMGDELNHLYLNYVPREELMRANRRLEEAKVELGLCQASSQVKIDKLKAQLAEAKSQLSDAKCLAEKFSKTEEFVVMQNKIMECGVNWSVRQASIEHPGIDFSFLPIRFKAACDNNFDDSRLEPCSRAKEGEEQFHDSLEMNRVDSDMSS